MDYQTFNQASFGFAPTPASPAHPPQHAQYADPHSRLQQQQPNPAYAQYPNNGQPYASNMAGNGAIQPPFTQARPGKPASDVRPRLPCRLMSPTPPFPAFSADMDQPRYSSRTRVRPTRRPCRHPPTTSLPPTRPRAAAARRTPSPQHTTRSTLRPSRRRRTPNPPPAPSRPTASRSP